MGRPTLDEETLIKHDAVEHDEDEIGMEDVLGTCEPTYENFP